MTNGRIDHLGWIAIGLISGLLALKFAPLVSGTMAIYAAVRLYRNQNKLHGLLIAVFGLICVILGVLRDVTALSPL